MARPHGTVGHKRSWKAGIFFSVLVFLLLNTAKIDWIDRFVLRDWHYVNQLKLLVYLSVNLFFFLVILRFRNRLVFAAFYALQAVYLFIHFSFFLFFDVPFHTRQAATELLESATIIRHFIVPWDWRYLVILIDLPAVVFLLIHFRALAGITWQKRRHNYLFWALLAVIGFLVPYSYRAFDIAEKLKNQYAGEMLLIADYGVTTNDILDSVLYFREAPVIKDFTYGNSLIVRRQAPVSPKNIICVQVESLDANMIGLDYQGRHVMPFLRDLAGHSVYYPFVFYYKLAGSTSDTEFAVLNNTVPSRFFPSMKLRNYDYPNSIVKELEKAGYATLAFHNNVDYFFNRDVAYFRMGFHHFYDRLKMGLKEADWGATDGDVLKYASRALAVQKQPFFAYIITMSSHYPYKWTSRFYKDPQFDSVEDERTRDFLNSFSYVDSVLRNFVTFIRANVKDTYIFIYGDHAAPIMNDYLFHKDRGVPLFIITPDGRQYREAGKTVSFLDLSSTILGASGVDFRIMNTGADLLNYPIKDSSFYLGSGQYRDREDSFRDLMQGLK